MRDAFLEQTSGPFGPVSCLSQQPEDIGNLWARPAVVTPHSQMLDQGCRRIHHCLGFSIHLWICSWVCPVPFEPGGTMYLPWRLAREQGDSYLIKARIKKVSGAQVVA